MRRRNLLLACTIVLVSCATPTDSSHRTVDASQGPKTVAIAVGWAVTFHWPGSIVQGHAILISPYYAAVIGYGSRSDTVRVDCLSVGSATGTVYFTNDTHYNIEVTCHNQGFGGAPSKMNERHSRVDQRGIWPIVGVTRPWRGKTTHNSAGSTPGARLMSIAWGAITALTSVHSLSAQSLAGTTGLVSIPTAEMPEDANLAVGVNLIDRRYHGYSNEGFDRHPALVEFASVGFLPFVEVGLRLTRVTGVPRQALGDRMLSVRLRLLDEATRRPAVVVGAHDLAGTRRFHTIYAVGSKTVGTVPRIGPVGLHLGYGGDPLSLRRVGSGLDGVFGGVSVAPAQWASLMAEYDTEHVNAGARLKFWRFALLAAAQNLDGFSAGISYTQPLHR